MQEGKESLLLKYRNAIVDFLKENSLKYTTNEENPNIIRTRIECKPANACFPLGITVTNDQMIWMVSLPPMPIAESKKEEINYKLIGINKGCHLLDFAIVDSGICGLVFLNIYSNDDAKQIVRNTYFVVKDDLENRWLPIVQVVFTNDDNNSSLAQLKRIIESDKETINLTIEEETSFSGRRFNGRLLGYTYALVDTRSYGKSSISEINSFNKIISFLKDYANVEEMKAIEKLLSIVRDSISIGCNTDMLLGQIEGIYAFVHQLPPSLLCLDSDITLGDKVSIEKEVESVTAKEIAAEKERVGIKELTSEDIHAALLKWDKSISELKVLCLKSGMSTSKAQILIDEVCCKINEERKRKMKPYLMAVAALIIAGIGICAIEGYFLFIVLIIVTFCFCIQKIYSICKQYRIKTS
jgi:hypothetical protein